MERKNRKEGGSGILSWGVGVKPLFILLGILAYSPLVYGEGEAVSSEELINYEKLTHTIKITKLRSGNHDESGSNDYIFRGQIYALAILKEERKKKFEERLKINKALGKFGDIEIKSLSYWEDPKDGTGRLVVNGDTIRQTASEAMRKFELTENRIAIMIEVEMIEKNKQFWFFGEDNPIGKTSFFVIPETIPHKPVTKNIDLEISDDKGVMVSFLVKYGKPEAIKKKIEIE